MNETKICSKCKIEQPIKNFAKDNLTKTKIRSQCTQCRGKYRQLKHNINPVKQMFYDAQLRAKKKNLPFDITLKWLEQKYTGYCELTGIEFQFANKGKNPNSPSIDRIDSSKGYTKDNVRLIIWRLNEAMSKYGLESLIELVNSINKFRC